MSDQPDQNLSPNPPQPAPEPQAAGPSAAPAAPVVAAPEQPEAAAVQAPVSVDADAPVASASASQEPAPIERPSPSYEPAGRGGGGRQGGPGRGPQQRRPREQSSEPSPYAEAVVKVFRCSRVVKGGRKFSFGALVVVGNRQGQVGLGYGKANEVPVAVEKATKEARRNLKPVVLRGTTLPHPVIGRCGASSVKLMPAAPGTGIIASAAVRNVLDVAGVTDVLTKKSGSSNPKNVCKATLDGLFQLRSRDTIMKLRGKTVSARPNQSTEPAAAATSA